MQTDLSHLGTPLIGRLARFRLALKVMGPALLFPLAWIPLHLRPVHEALNPYLSPPIVAIVAMLIALIMVAIGAKLLRTTRQLPFATLPQAPSVAVVRTLVGQQYRFRTLNSKFRMSQMGRPLPGRPRWPGSAMLYTAVFGRWQALERPRFRRPGRKPATSGSTRRSGSGRLRITRSLRAWRMA